MKTQILLLVIILTASASHAQNGWEQLNSMNIANGGSESCVMDSMIYVFGGVGATSTYITGLNSAEVYNIETNQWTDLAPIPIDVTETNVGVINNKIYLSCGWNGVKTIDLTFEYNPEDNSWKTLKACPVKTGTNSSCVLNDTLYILGGLEYPSHTEQNQFIYYVPETNNWGSGPDMIFKQGGYASAHAYDNEIFIFGGITDNFLIHGKSEKYNPMEKKWLKLADMPVPVLNHIIVNYDGKIYIFGGDVKPYSHAGSSTTNIIQEFDPSTNQWRLMESMPFKRANMTGQKVGNYLYLIGGYPNDSRNWNSALSEVWRYNLDSLKVWEPR